MEWFIMQPGPVTVAAQWRTFSTNYIQSSGRLCQGGRALIAKMPARIIVGSSPAYLYRKILPSLLDGQSNITYFLLLIGLERKPSYLSS